MSVSTYLHAYLHKVPSSGNLHLRVKLSTGFNYSDELKEALHRVGSPATYSPAGAPFTWDYPLTAAAVVTLQRVADERGITIEWSPDLAEFALAQKKLEDYERQVRMSIEKAMRDNESLPDYPTRLMLQNGKPCPPMRHQRLSYHWGLRSTGLLLAHEPGLGKTRSACDLIGGWYRENIVRPMTQMWIPAQYDKKGIFEGGNRWGVKGGGLVVCPKGMMRTWRDELALWQNANGLEISGGSRAKKTQRAGMIAHAHIVNYESLSVVSLNEYDFIVLDECFVVGTLVWTKQGPMPIEKIKIGDEVWSYCHETDTPQLKTVENTFVSEPVGAILRVETEHGYFLVTEGHPFFTAEGYIEAGHLEVGDYIMLGVRNACDYTTTELSSENMRREMQINSTFAYDQRGKKTGECARALEGSTMCGLREAVYSSEQVSSVENMPGKMQVGINRKTIGGLEQGVLFCSNESRQPNEEKTQQGESESNPVSNEPQTTYTRGEWERPDSSGRHVIQGTSSLFSDSGDAVYICNEKEVPLPRALQNRHRNTGKTNSDRGRWVQPSGPRTKEAGREEGKFTARTRVVSVAVHQQRGFEQRTKSSRKHPLVYNVEVADNHNYYVGSVPHLVHNCHRCSNNSGFTTNSLELSQNTRRRVGLSGTPVSNSLESVFYQMLILDGGRSLGASKTAFIEKWFHSEMVGKGQVENKPKENAIQEVSKLMSRCTYFLKKDECLDLPPRIHTKQIVEMTTDQERYYQELKKETLVYIQDSSVTVEQAASRMMKLRQVTQGFVLDDERNPKTFNNAKLDALIDILINKLPGRKVVVWAVFTHEIDLICLRLKEMNLGYVRFDGTVTSKKVRDANLHMWNNDNRITVFVGQIQMGVGITLHAQAQKEDLALQAGEMQVPCYDCVYMDLDYSFTNWTQSVDRIHRIGQAYSCNYTYLLTPDGIDQAIYTALQAKANTAQTVHVTGKAFFRSLLTGDTPSLAAVA